MIKKKYILLFIIAIIPNIMNAIAVKNIEIKDTGITVTENPGAGEINACKQFIPTKNQLLNFFKLAEEAEYNKWLHEYYSSCISTGSIEFENGTSGNWVIQSSGIASVIMNDGSSANFFYKDNEWDDPNACTYGLGDEPNPDPGC
ncbi:hypothetical protein [Morganella morganii]|uniref:hypothetical protein n=1 Tax=Morganella morganii TaxID=582 RepID=UPI0032D9D969